MGVEVIEAPLQLFKCNFKIIVRFTVILHQSNKGRAVLVFGVKLPEAENCTLFAMGSSVKSATILFCTAACSKSR